MERNREIWTRHREMTTLPVNLTEANFDVIYILTQQL